MLVAAIMAPAIVVTVFVLLRNVALENSYTMGALFGLSTALRASLFGLVVLFFGGGYSLWSFTRVKDGAVLELEDGAIRFRRPGAPITGWFARDVSIDPKRVDRVEVSKQRHITLERVELAVEAGRERIVVNLGHATGPDQKATSQLLDREVWLEQPLVRAVEELTGREAVRG